MKCFFLLLLFNACFISDENINLNRTICINRSVIEEDVSATLDDNTIYIMVSGYTGIVCYEIESIDGEGGFLSGSQAVYGNGTVSVSTMSLDAGSYTIWIRAGYEYIGSFDI